MKAGGLPQEAKAFSLDLSGGPANGSTILGLSFGVTTIDLGALGPLILDPATIVLLPMKLDGKGDARLAATLPTGLAGAVFYAQAVANEFTNAVVVRISK